MDESETPGPAPRDPSVPRVGMLLCFDGLLLHLETGPGSLVDCCVAGGRESSAVAASSHDSDRALGLSWQ